MLTTSELNITPLTDRLWTGGDLPDPLPIAADHVAAWVERGIDHVVDCRLEWSDETLLRTVAPSVEYTNVGVDDAGQRMPDAWFDAVTSASLATLRQGGSVLVHCHMGINRGPSGAFATLLALGWDPVAAIDLIRNSRPIAAVGYAEDALDWWHRKSRASAGERVIEWCGLETWRREHPHDTVRIIREIRSGERR